MIIVDDRLSLDAAAGRLSDRVPDLTVADGVATTWSFHYRLLRALTERRSTGFLSRPAEDDALAQVAAPPPSRLVVLDPRSLTAEAARQASRHRLNVLAAELVAAAVVHQASVVLSEPNLGRHWTQVFDEERIEVRVVEAG